MKRNQISKFETTLALRYSLRFHFIDVKVSSEGLLATAVELERRASFEMSETIGLPDFLKQIGAASLSPKLVLPVEGAEAPLASLHARLDAEIESVNVSPNRFCAAARTFLTRSYCSATNASAAARELARIRATIQHRRTTFRANGGAGALARRSGGRNGWRRESPRCVSWPGTILTHSRRRQNAFLPPLLSTLVVHSRLAQTHSENTHALAALSELTALHLSISNLSSNVTSGALPLAVAALSVVRQQLGSTNDQWVKETETWEVLRKWAAEEDARLESALVGALEGAFSFENTAQGESKLVISERVAAAPRGEWLSISQIIDTLDQLLASSSPPRNVDSHLARIAKQLHKYFLTPLFESGSHSNGPKTIVFSQNGEEKSAALQAAGFGQQDVIATTQQFLSFFATHSSLLPPSRFAPSFTVNFTPSLQALVVSDHLIPSLPLSTATLPPYLPTLEFAATFERDFLVGSGYLAFLPKGRESSCEEGTVVREWIDRVDVHWARRVGDATFEKVLQVIRGGDWEGQLVDVYVEEEIEVEEEEIIAPKYVEVTDSEAESEDEQLDEDGFQPFGSPTLVPAPIPIPTAPFSKPKLGTKITPVPIPTSPQASNNILTNIAPAPSATARKMPSTQLSLPAPAPAPPPISRPYQPASIEPDEPMDEEDDPWGLSSSPADASPNLLPTNSPSLLPAPSSYDNGLLPPTRARAQSASSSAGSEDPWGLSADLDLEDQTSVKAESIIGRAERGVVEEVSVEEEAMDDGWGFVEPTTEEVEPLAEGEDAWGFDESEAAVEEEESVIEEEVLALSAEERAEASPSKSPSTIPLPFSPAMNDATMTPLVAPDSPPPSHAKKDSLGGWGWEDPDDQVDADAAPPPVISTSHSKIARSASNGTTTKPKPAKIKNVKQKKMKLVVVPPVVRIKQESRRIKEQMLVSNRSRSIVAIAEEILLEALEVGSQSSVLLSACVRK